MGEDLGGDTKSTVDDEQRILDGCRVNEHIRESIAQHASELSEVDSRVIALASQIEELCISNTSISDLQISQLDSSIAALASQFEQRILDMSRGDVLLREPIAQHATELVAVDLRVKALALHYEEQRIVGSTVHELVREFAAQHASELHAVDLRLHRDLRSNASVT